MILNNIPKTPLVVKVQPDQSDKVFKLSQCIIEGQAVVNESMN